MINSLTLSYTKYQQYLSQLTTLSFFETLASLMSFFRSPFELHFRPQLPLFTVCFCFFSWLVPVYKTSMCFCAQESITAFSYWRTICLDVTYYLLADNVEIYCLQQGSLSARAYTQLPTHKLHLDVQNASQSENAQNLIMLSVSNLLAQISLCNPWQG